MYHIAGILQAKEKLQKEGHAVETPDLSAKAQNDASLDQEAIAHLREKLVRQHLAKIENSDAILVYNDEKNSIPNYIGGSTLIEMAFAFALHKPIFLYNAVPDIAYTDEILGLRPVVLHGKLEDIK